MGANGKMGIKKSTCIYLNKEILETAKQMGLNVSRVSENALKEAIDRLTEPKRETGLNSQADREGRGRDSNPGARLHRPVGYQATSPRPHFSPLGATCAV
jgi:post-segregation antitoxin (ccd killing protein)